MSELYPTSENSNLPPGPQGPKGDTGVGLPGADGVDAFSILAAAFAQPGSSGDVTVTLNSSEWLAIGQNVYLENGGYYRVIALPSTTSAVLRNLGVSTNAAALSVIPAGSKLSAAGVSDTSFQTQLDLLDGRTDSLETAVLALQSAVVSGVSIANVGDGEGLLFAGVSGSTQRFRSLKANGGISISVSGDNILLTGTAGSFSVVHSGTGQTLIKGVVSGVTTLKGLTAGTGIGLTVSANGIQIENTLTLPTVSVDGLLSLAHVGSDYAVALFEADLPVADITGSGLITVTPTGNSFDVGLAVADLPVQSVVAGAGVATVNTAAGEVTVAVPATTITHVAGTGIGVLSSASGTQVTGKKLVAGTNVTLTDSAGLITIDAGGGSGSGDVVSSTSDLDYYVSNSGNDTTGDGSSGAPFATLERVLTALRQKALPPGKNKVVVNFPIGAYSLAGTFVLNGFNCPYLLEFKGTKQAATITSIQATSGSNQAYTINVNLGTNPGVVVGDFIVVRSPSGGTNPSAMAGFFRVTAVNVDGVANRISVLSRHTFVPSGAVAASDVFVFKSSVVYNGKVFSIIDSTGVTFTDLVVDHTDAGGICSIEGVRSSIYGAYVNTIGGGIGLVFYQSECYLYEFGCTSTSTAVASRGIAGSIGSRLWAVAGVIVGANIGVLVDRGTNIVMNGCWVCDCAIGQHAYTQAGLWFDGGATERCTTGVGAGEGSIAKVTGHTFVSCTTNTVPAVNTLGNVQSYIIS